LHYQSLFIHCGVGDEHHQPASVHLGIDNKIRDTLGRCDRDIPSDILFNIYIYTYCTGVCLLLLIDTRVLRGDGELSTGAARR
jgi:hypothetical protein